MSESTAVQAGRSGWWRSAVIYQVYVRSFQDSDGDGVGDLGGVRASLPYLRSLGVDGIWLNPFYPSPQHDHGYDVSDYVAVHAEYGTLECFDRLIHDALAQFKQGRTTFFITHKMHTVQMADRIVVLDNHAIAAVGTHAELVASSPVYRGLYEAQIQAKAA